MNITFKSVHLHNFMSFKDSEINIDDKGYVLVSGRNNSKNDCASSNGSGKSSIWEGIVWCLTGETIRGSKNVTNIFSDERNTYVTIDFICDNISYEITRSKDPSTLKIIVNGEDKSGKGIRDSEKLLSQYLPELSASLIGSVIVLGQGLPQRFSNNTPSGRKQVLEQLSQSDFMIEDIKAKLAARKSYLNTKLDENTIKKAQVETSINILQQERISVENSLSSLENIADLHNKLYELTNKKQNIEEELQERNNEKSFTYGSLQAKKNELAVIDADNDKTLDEINNRFSNSIDAKQDELNNITVKYNTVCNEINKIESIKEICPTCGQRISGVIKPDITQLVIDREKLQNSIDSYKSQLNSLKTNYYEELKEAKEKSSAYKSALDCKIDDLYTTVKKCDAIAATLSVDIRNVERSISSISNQIELHDVRENEYNSRLDSIETELTNLNTQLLYYNNELENTTQHMAVVDRMITFAKRDFRGVLLQNVINFIDAKAKDYSETVFGTRDISFCQDGNTIDISYNGKEYESLSGGEQKKIDIIIQFSIRNMLCKLLNFSSNIIVCDELFDALDNNGCQKILNLISDKLTDVSSVFIVTHRSNLSIPYDNEILVVKDEDNISYVVQ